MLREYERRGAEVAFMEWLIYDHRPRRRGPTVAEQLLATGLPPAERTLLEAHINERPSLYRVVEVSAGDSLVMEDLFEGGTVRIHDILLSECANDQICLPARVVKAGRFQFISPPRPVPASSCGAAGHGPPRGARPRNNKGGTAPEVTPDRAALAMDG